MLEGIINHTMLLCDAGC